MNLARAWPAPLETLIFIGREGGIRTLDGLQTHTHFPGVLLQPLGHLSKTRLHRDDGGNPNQPHLAHEAAATVAPFRAWRSSQLVIARGPTWVTIDHGRSMLAELDREV